MSSLQTQTTPVLPLAPAQVSHSAVAHPEAAKVPAANNFSLAISGASNALADSANKLDNALAHAWSGLVGAGTMGVIGDVLNRHDWISLSSVALMGVVGLAGGMYLAIPKWVRKQRYEAAAYRQAVAALTEGAAKTRAMLTGAVKTEFEKGLAAANKILIARFLGGTVSEAASDAAVNTLLLANNPSPPLDAVVAAAPAELVPKTN
jgi:hypothetical protein